MSADVAQERPWRRHSCLQRRDSLENPRPMLASRYEAEDDFRALGRQPQIGRRDLQAYFGRRMNRRDPKQDTAIL